MRKKDSKKKTTTGQTKNNGIETGPLFRGSVWLNGPGEDSGRITEEDVTVKIEKKAEGNKLTVALEGRLDTTTAPELDAVLKDSLGGVEDLTMDFEGLEYISSAGLRVLLATQKVMNKQGKMKVIHVNEVVMDVFDVTGFADILTIE